jgi:hypothetical protein
MYPFAYPLSKKTFMRSHQIIIPNHYHKNLEPHPYRIEDDLFLLLFLKNLIDSNYNYARPMDNSYNLYPVTIINDFPYLILPTFIDQVDLLLSYNNIDTIFNQIYVIKISQLNPSYLRSLHFWFPLQFRTILILSYT